MSRVYEVVVYYYVNSKNRVSVVFGIADGSGRVA